IAVISSWKLFGTSSETTSSVIANANTASLKLSMRETSRRCMVTLEILKQPGRLVQQDVDEHAGDRDVHPDRERPARDGAMPRIVGLETARERDDGQRQYHEGQADVRDQNREVQRTDEPLPREPDVADLRVIDEIAHEEQRRRAERRDHEPAVHLDLPCF